MYNNNKNKKLSGNTPDNLFHILSRLLLEKFSHSRLLAHHILSIALYSLLLHISAYIYLQLVYIPILPTTARTSHNVA